MRHEGILTFFVPKQIIKRDKIRDTCICEYLTLIGDQGLTVDKQMTFLVRFSKGNKFYESHRDHMQPEIVIYTLFFL